VTSTSSPAIFSVPSWLNSYIRVFSISVTTSSFSGSVTTGSVTIGPTGSVTSVCAVDVVVNGSSSSSTYVSCTYVLEVILNLIAFEE
jgi:hypothetical protein